MNMELYFQKCIGCLYKYIKSKDMSVALNLLQWLNFVVKAGVVKVFVNGFFLYVHREFCLSASIFSEGQRILQT